MEISVVYYRSCYTPTDYPTDVEWDSRLLIERSRAIKCPSIGLQLAGAKKVQQVLAEPGRLEKYLSSSSSPSTSTLPGLSQAEMIELRSSFTNLFPLDDTLLGQEALKMAYDTPARFVLKPQREGGGNNIYRHSIPPFLDNLASLDASRSEEGGAKEREGYILMDLIEVPKGVESVMVRAGSGIAARGEAVSELGIYGYALFESTSHREKGASEMTMLENENCGHLLRTKGVESDEGGVAVGYSVIDSVCLV